MPDIGNILRGFAVQLVAPDIARGAIIEMLRGVTVEKASEWIANNNSLWETFSPEKRASFKKLARRAGDLDFLTVSWVIDSLRKDSPSLASLFLGWKKGHNWLERQVEIIKKEIKS